MKRGQTLDTFDSFIKMQTELKALNVMFQTVPLKD